jgi:hypothetical protein
MRMGSCTLSREGRREGRPVSVLLQIQRLVQFNMNATGEYYSTNFFRTSISTVVRIGMRIYRLRRQAYLPVGRIDTRRVLSCSTCLLERWPQCRLT